MSDTSQGPGWWLASDGRWYPPQSAPLPPPPLQTPPLQIPPLQTPPLQTYAPPSAYQPSWAGPPPSPAKQGHGCLWAVLAAIGVVVVGVVVVIVALVVAGHKIRNDINTTGNLAGAPPPARYTVGQTGGSSGLNFTVYTVRAPL